MLAGTDVHVHAAACSQRGEEDPLSPAERVRVARLRQELGDGEGVSSLLAASLRDSDAGGDGRVGEPDLLSPPSSPRQRYHTFGATLDFIEVLRDLCCSRLTADRTWQQTCNGTTRPDVTASAAPIPSMVWTRHT